MHRKLAKETTLEIDYHMAVLVEQVKPFVGWSENHSLPFTWEGLGITRLITRLHSEQR
jgi:hypothetical protein